MVYRSVYGHMPMYDRLLFLKKGYCRLVTSEPNTVVQTIINLYLGLKPSLSNEATQVQNRSEMHHNRNNTEDCHGSLYCMTCISNP